MINTSNKPLLFTTGIMIMILIALIMSGCAGTTESGVLEQARLHQLQQPRRAVGMQILTLYLQFFSHSHHALCDPFVIG